MAITDSLEYLPPANYNTDIRPGLGGTYVDPVFGETVRQMSAIGSQAADDNNYSICRVNCDGTLYMCRVAGVMDIRYTADATVYKASQPQGSGNFSSTNVMFHPTDPNIYFFWQYTGIGRGLYERNLSAQTSTWIKDFGFDLATLGGSVNFCDKTGRYFVVQKASPEVGVVWDRVEDALYTGDIPSFAVTNNGWLGMSPSGQHVISSREEPAQKTYSHALNHATNTATVPGTVFLVMGTGHAVPVSGSDGNDYCIVSDADATGGIWRIDVTANNSGLTYPTDLASHTGATKLFDITVFNDRHSAHGPIGAGQDWSFVSTESGPHDADSSDGYNSTHTGATWHPFKQEIVAVNYLTGAVRRLCHHRSRGDMGFYYTQPRPSCSWNGSFVLYASNMNDSTPNNYSDLYGIANPLGTQQDATVLRRIGQMVTMSRGR